jgi:hypothetical protein
MKAADPSRYSISLCPQQGNDVSAQLFFDGDQFAEVIVAGSDANVMFFGPGDGEPPHLDLGIVVDLLLSAGRRLSP